MASYLDNQPLPLTPYIGKYDVNAYVQAGMEKQQQYNQGVQRVQGVLDSVGGLEVYGDHRKQYVQSKVDDLTSKLQSVAGADWSNPAMLNQVGALAGQIYKDPTIQNAVASASQIKSLMASQKQLKDKSPDQYAPQNEAYDNSAVQAYLNNPDVGANYNGPTQATKYYDPEKPIVDKVSKLGPEVSYKLNADGQYQIAIDKSSKIRPEDIDALVRETISQDPRIGQQLAIDANYNYKNYSPTDLKRNIAIYNGNKVSNLEQLNNELAAEKLKLGNDPIAAAQYDNQIAFNKNKIDGIKSNNKEYFDAIDNGNMDAVKQAYYRDHFSDKYVINYQKNNHELELKANENAINTTKFTLEAQKVRIENINAGIDPDTGKPMDINNPYYGLYLNKVKGAKKNADGTAATDEQQLVGKGGSTGEYSFQKNEDNINSLVKKGTDLDEALKREYYKKNNLTPGPDAVNSYKQWKALQENAFQNQTGNVDPEYLNYKQMSRENTVQLGVLGQLRDDINKDAESKYSIANTLNQPIVIEGVHVEGAHRTDGSIGSANRVVVNPAKDTHFMTELSSILAKSNQYRTEANNGAGVSSTTGIVSSAPNSNNIDPVMQALDEYKNSPDYTVLKALLTQKRQETLNKLVHPVEQLLNTKTDYINKQYNEKGVNWNPKYSVISGDKEYMEQQKNLVAQAINLNAGGKINNTSIDVDKIHPNSTYTDPITGELHIVYNTGDDKKFQDIVVPTDKNVTNPAPSDQWLVRAIETSPDKRTPLKGDGVLASYDGKIRYAIGKREPLLGGGYQLYILSGQNPIAVPLPTGAAQTPGGIQYQIEQWTKTVNPATGKPMTAEEIIKTATNQ